MWSSRFRVGLREISRSGPRIGPPNEVCGRDHGDFLLDIQGGAAEGSTQPGNRSRHGLGLVERDADGHFKGYDADVALHDLLRVPNRDRLFAVYEALLRGDSQATVSQLSGFDPWFAAQIGEIAAMEQQLSILGLYRRGSQRYGGFGDWAAGSDRAGAPSWGIGRRAG